MASNPYLNGGTCVAEALGYPLCNCRPGYGGNLCQTGAYVTSL